MKARINTSVLVPAFSSMQAVLSESKAKTPHVFFMKLKDTLHLVGFNADAFCAIDLGVECKGSSIEFDPSLLAVLKGKGEIDISVSEQGTQLLLKQVKGKYSGAIPCSLQMGDQEIVVNSFMQGDGTPKSVVSRELALHLSEAVKATTLAQIFSSSKLQTIVSVAGGHLRVMASDGTRASYYEVDASDTDAKVSFDLGVSATMFVTIAKTFSKGKFNLSLRPSSICASDQTMTVVLPTQTVDMALRDAISGLVSDNGKPAYQARLKVGALRQLINTLFPYYNGSSQYLITGDTGELTIEIRSSIGHARDSIAIGKSQGQAALQVHPAALRDALGHVAAESAVLRLVTAGRPMVLLSAASGDARLFYAVSAKTAKAQ